MIKFLKKCKQKIFLYYFSKKYKNAWAIMDRIDYAADNGILFFDYITRMHPKTNVYFVLAKNALNFNELKKKYKKQLVEYGSREHRWLTYYSIVDCSAYFSSPAAGFPTLAYRGKFLEVYLDHGWVHSDSSDHLVGLHKNVYCMSLKIAYNFYCKKFQEKNSDVTNLFFTGSPRIDLINENAKKYNNLPRNTIIIAPTWRKYLKYKKDNITRQPLSEFENSEYLRIWNELFNSKELAKLQQKYKIIFLIHPEFIEFAHCFNLPKFIESKTYSNIDIHKVGFSTQLFITDYSGTLFDMALMGAMIVNFQFDKNLYYSHRNGFSKGWYNSDNELGLNFNELKNLREYLLKMQKTDLQDKYNEQYNINYKNIFCDLPTNSCEKIYRIIKQKSKEFETNNQD